MMKLMMFLPVLALSGLMLTGCNKPADAPPEGTTNVSADVSLCGECGQVKGSEACCAEGAETCEGCQFCKGSPACCKASKDDVADGSITLCGKCGQVKGSDTCCKEDAEVCEKCKLHKGSPGCCQKDVLAARTEEKPAT